jgi:hypothetical protein
MNAAFHMLCHTIAFMAKEADPQVVEATAEPLAEQAPEGRLNAAATAFMTGVLQHICGLTVTGGALPTGPQQIGLMTAVPAAGANGTAVGAALKPVAWGTVTGGGGAVATVTAPAIQFTGVTPGTYAAYGIFNASGTYLYGKAFTAITIPTGATGTITVTPTHTYDLT